MKEIPKEEKRVDMAAIDALVTLLSILSGITLTVRCSKYVNGVLVKSTTKTFGGESEEIQDGEDTIAPKDCRPSLRCDECGAMGYPHSFCLGCGCCEKCYPPDGDYCQNCGFDND